MAEMKLYIGRFKLQEIEIKEVCKCPYLLKYILLGYVYTGANVV